MRLFAKVDGSVDREDRPMFFVGTIFTRPFLGYIVPNLGDLAAAIIPPVYSRSPRLSMFVSESYNGVLVDDWTGAQGVVIGTFEHGFGELRGFIPMALQDAFTYYRYSDPLHLVVTDGLDIVYEGRVEDLAITGEGLSFGAFGYWRALTDLKVSAMFCYSLLDAWDVLSSSDVAACIPDRFATDKYNRLYASPEPDQTYSSSVAHCSFGFRIPDKGITSIRRIKFSYAFKAPSPWKLKLSRCNSDWSITADVWTITGNGSEQSATGHSVSVSACDALRFTLYYDSTAAGYSSPTGTDYARITDVKISFIDEANTYSTDVVSALVDVVNSVNPTQLSADTSQISDSDLALLDALHEDARPADIVSELAAMGGDASVAEPWIAAVWEDRRVHFGPRHHLARYWYVDVVAIELERSFDSVVNAAYASYRQDSNGTKRTALVAPGIAAVRRYDSIDVATTSVPVAERFRDLLVAARSSAPPRATIRTVGVFDESGARYPLYRVRAGDYMVVRNLPPDLPGDMDTIRVYRIGRTQYDAETDELQPEPDSPVPTLAVLVSRREQRL